MASASPEATLLHSKPRGMAPKSKDKMSPCLWDGSRGCWVDVDGSDHVPLSEAERKKKSRKRNEPTPLADGLTWHPCLVVGEPVPMGQLVVVGEKKQKLNEPTSSEISLQKLEERTAPPAPPSAPPTFEQSFSTVSPPSFPWQVRRARRCSLHGDRCTSDVCPVVAMQRCLSALARQPFVESRRLIFEDAYEEARTMLACAEVTPEAHIQPPDWHDTHNDPWAREASIYPRYDGLYHVVLRDEPRPGHVWVAQPEEIDIDYTDGGPPKLKEWQIPADDVDASYIQLPWRVPRRVLETSGAHEAEQRGDFVCRRVNCSMLPDACSHCYHTRSRCSPRCHPPFPLAGLRLEWETKGYCSEMCFRSSMARCRPCDQHRIEMGAQWPAIIPPEVQRWKALYGSPARCTCCSSAPSAEIRSLEWADEICSNEWHEARKHFHDRDTVKDDWLAWRYHLWYLEERRADAYAVLAKARADAVSK